MFKTSLQKGRWIQQLFRQTDNSTLIIFRIIYGLLLFYHCIHFIISGKLYRNFIEPPFTFSYIGFEWLQPLPGYGMYTVFALMALLALMIMAGAFYRFAITGFTVLWIWVYLMQKSGYNNHYYLVLLLCLLMCCMPAHRYFSVDVKRRPALIQNSCPQWVYFLLMAQTGVIYFYAAISKLDAGWLSGKFIALQFAPLTTKRFVGGIYANEYFQWLIVYGGFLFDLFIVPLLLWRKTRYYAFILFCGFHLFNSYSFGIGIFPWLSIAMGLFFLPAQKIRAFFFKYTPAMNMPSLTPASMAFKKRAAFAIGLYLLMQCILPLRSVFFPGNVLWTEEGYRMSWKMMLRTKTGTIHFKVSDPASGKTWYIHPEEKFTASHVRWLAISPDIVWQYAQRLKKEFAAKGYPLAEVYATDSVSLNKNPPQLLIDTAVNLAAARWQYFGHNAWILPYRNP